LEARAKERRVGRGVPISQQDSNGNSGARRIEAAADEVAARVDNRELVAGYRSSLDAQDGLFVDPRMAGPNRLNVSRLEGERRHPM
jgi:hypothetical protein